MPFDPLNIDLPVVEIIPEFKRLLSENNTLVVSAPPGAGKSTLLPLTLLDELWLHGKKIIMLEPRRLATRAIAGRMASLIREEVGATVGYTIRFEKKISSATKLEVVTEGVLTRMLLDDNALEDYGAVIFDEFHERSLHAEVALALTRDLQQVLRPDLRIIVMSATLNLPKLRETLNAPVIESKGRQHHVDVIYTNDADEYLLPELAAKVIYDAVNKHPGDTLVFLPGEGEIKKCAEILSSQMPSFRIHPLYGQLPPAAQHAAIMPDRNGNRKIVIATSIAETSLTIEGVRIVVDCGFTRKPKFDPASGLSKLETVRISKDSADQRAGRAGRLSDGVCYRMWTLATHSRLAEHRVPEILEADLTSMVLDLAHWQVTDIQRLAWLTPPPRGAVFHALETLQQLDAMEENSITPHGKELNRLPCHPRIAHMLLLARKRHLASLAVDIAAVVEERDPLGRDEGIDICKRIEALRNVRQRGNSGRWARIIKIAESYSNMLKGEISNEAFDCFDAGYLLACAYPERIGCARPGNNAQFQLSNGRFVAAGHKDDLAHQPWLAVAHADLREGTGKIFLAAPLNPTDLREMVKEYENIKWDSRKNGLIANLELRIGSIVLQSKSLQAPDPGKVAQAIAQVIKSEGLSLLNISTEFEQLQNRIRSLAVWRENEEWPDVSTETLLADTAWLLPYLGKVQRNEDLKKIDLSHALYNFLPWELQQRITLLAPEKIEVPSGSKITLKYFPNGANPVLEVRLQEVFGLPDTPRVNDNRIPVVMHLLSPGYKPVQVTSDLKSFWNNMYFEVKRELQRRYPKHSWPDDPWTARPVAKGRSHK
jgi:ATP-dependent helicase HrpB